MTKLKIPLASTEASTWGKSKEEPWLREANEVERKKNQSWRAKVIYKIKSDSLKSHLIEHHRPPSRTVSFPQREFLTFRKAESRKRNAKTNTRLSDSNRKRWKTIKLRLILTFGCCANTVWTCDYKCVRAMLLLMLCDANRSSANSTKAIDDLGWIPKSNNLLARSICRLDSRKATRELEQLRASMSSLSGRISVRLQGNVSCDLMSCKELSVGRFLKPHLANIKSNASA